MLKQPRRAELKNAYLGPEFSDSRIQSALQNAGLESRQLDREALLDAVAERIAAGDVVGWFQGRMEWGPRALGNRSIVAHPGLPNMKDVLNARIKHREWFRPFAPSIMSDYQHEYFEHDHPSPFMLHVYKIRPDKRRSLCAVNHVDDTGRLQSVTRQENPLYYDLISAFHRKTGIPVILNTSFNENEPIVCTPEEAIDCFQRTRMDVLAIGPFVVVKARQDTGTLTTSLAPEGQQYLAGRAALSQCTKKPVSVMTVPITPSRIPKAQKMRRPESRVMDVMTRPISRKTSARSKRSARSRSRATSASISRALSSISFCSPLYRSTSLGIFFAQFCQGCRIGRWLHGRLLKKEFVSVAPDVFGLIVSPLIGRFGLQDDFLGVGTVPEQGDDRYENSQNRHGQRYGGQASDLPWHAQRVPVTRLALLTSLSLP